MNMILASGIGLLAAAMAMTAQAAPITFTDVAIVSGTLNGTPFALERITITGSADTDSVADFLSLGFSVANIAASVTIEHLGTYAFTSGTQFFVNNTNMTVGFGRSGLGGDLLDGPTDPSLATWDMLSSIGPLSGFGAAAQWDLSPVHTTGGVLVLTTGFTDVTFSAMVEPVPEPASVLLLGAGVAMLGITRRRRR